MNIWRPARPTKFSLWRAFGCMQFAAAAYLESCFAQAIRVPVWWPCVDEWQPLQQPTAFDKKRRGNRSSGRESSDCLLPEKEMLKMRPIGEKRGNNYSAVDSRVLRLVKYQNSTLLYWDVWNPKLARHFQIRWSIGIVDRANFYPKVLSLPLCHCVGFPITCKSIFFKQASHQHTLQFANLLSQRTVPSCLFGLLFGCLLGCLLGWFERWWVGWSVVWVDSYVST